MSNLFFVPPLLRGTLMEISAGDNLAPMITDVI